MKKHPEVKRRGKTVDVSDLLEDPIVIYQRKYVGSDLNLKLVD